MPAWSKYSTPSLRVWQLAHPWVVPPTLAMICQVISPLKEMAADDSQVNSFRWPSKQDCCIILRVPLANATTFQDKKTSFKSCLTRSEHWCAGNPTATFLRINGIWVPDQTTMETVGSYLLLLPNYGQKMPWICWSPMTKAWQRIAKIIKFPIM